MHRKSEVSFFPIDYSSAQLWPLDIGISSKSNTSVCIAIKLIGFYLYVCVFVS